MAKYKIDDVAKECGLTKRTIRYYEEIGLLFAADRSEGGYRLYGDNHIERLKQIINARDVLGFSLQEVQEFVAVSEELQEHRKGIKQVENEKLKLEKLAEMEHTLQKQLQLIDQKLEKLTEFRQDVLHLNQRVQEAKQKYTNKKE